MSLAVATVSYPGAYPSSYGGGYADTWGQATLAVTDDEVIAELNNRGYTEEEPHVPVHHVVVPPTVTRRLAINMACDTAIAGYNLPHTTTHPYRCNMSGGCPVAPSKWKNLVGYTAGWADYYLKPGATIPTWVTPAMVSLLSGTYGLSGLGRAPSGFMTTAPAAPEPWYQWFKNNPWSLTAAGGILNSLGAHLTAENVKDELRKAIPPDVLTAQNFPAILAELQAQNPGLSQDVLKEGLKEAVAMPGWVIPVLIGAGVFLIVMMMKK